MSDDSDRCEPASEVDVAYDRYYQLQRIVSEAEWTANLALAYALAQPKDDRAVLHLEEALRRGRQDPEVLATAAAVRATRGEIARARDLYTRAYAATRGAGPRARIREKMAALEEVAP